MFLDGTNTDSDPYNCQPVTPYHPGIYISKSLSLIGSGSKARITCTDGHVFIFSGLDSDLQMEVILRNLEFHNTPISFLDSVAEIHHCTFSGVRQNCAVNTTLVNKSLLAFSVHNSLFQNNSASVSAVIDRKVSDGKPPTRMSINMTDTSFRNNQTTSFSNVIFSATTTESARQMANCTVIFENVSFRWISTEGTNTALKIDIENATSTIQFNEVVFNETTGGPFTSFLTYCTLRSSQSITVLINNSTSLGYGTAFKISSSKVVTQVWNSSFVGKANAGFRNNGGAISVESENVSQLSVFNCTFLGTLGSYGGAIYLRAAAQTFVQIQNSLFAGTKALNEGEAICISVQGLLSVTIADSIIKDATCAICGRAIPSSGAVSISGSNVTVLIRRSTFTGRRNEGTYGVRNGGALALTADLLYLTVQNSSFVEFIADNGGAISIMGGTAYVSFSSVVMKSNKAWQQGGGVNCEGQIHLTAAHSVFDDQQVDGRGGSCLFISSTPSSRIHILNTSFTNSNSSGPYAGAVYSQLAPHSRFIVEGCTFVNNSAVQAPGGAIMLSMTGDKLINTGCDENNPTYRSWKYSSNVSFTNTRFESNTARNGGAISLVNGETAFQKCVFKDNFALIYGGHVATSGDSSSVVFYNSSFLQTQGVSLSNVSTSSFIHMASAGPLVFNTTTLYSRVMRVGNPILVVSNGGLVDFGNAKKSQLMCGVGSRMEFVNLSYIHQNENTLNETCLNRVTFFQFSCHPCPSGSYSLQRGQTQGLHVDDIKCLPCPYGADCLDGIVALENFWGYEVLKENPPRLKFTLCPLEYCSPPKDKSPQIIYNGCQGNRTGVLCGECNKTFTETLYSSHCRPIDKCNDYWFWPVGFLLVSAMALYLIIKPPVFSWLSRHIFWFKANQNEENEQPSFDRGYMKIVFYFYQIANLLSLPTSPPVMLQAYMVHLVVGLFNFQQTLTASDGLSCPFPGITVVTKQLFHLLNVIGTLIMIYVICGIQYVVGRIRGREPPKLGPHLGATLEVLLLGYSSVVTVSFRLLRCVSIGSEKKLFYDGNIVCFSQRWQYLIVGFIAGFVVPVVFVLAWGSLKLYKQTAPVKHFLLACVFPLPFLLYWTFTCCCGRQDEEEGHPEWRASLQKVLYEPFSKPDQGRDVISWESVLIGRRLLLVILFISITDPLPRLLSMTFTCVLILLHHSVTQPFRDRKANLAETVSLVGLVALAIINTFQSVFLSLGVTADGGPMESQLFICDWLELAIFGLLPVLFVLALTMTVMSQLVRVLLWGCKILGAYWVRCCHNSKTDERKPLLHSPTCDVKDEENS